MPLIASGILNFVLDALDRAPVEARLRNAVLHPAPAGGDEALGDVALAPAVMRGVDGERKGGIAMLDRARDMIVDPGRVAADIELVEPQRRGRGSRQLFEPGLADRAQHVRAPELLDPAHDRFRAGGVKALERADRREHDRQAELPPELAHRCVDLADVAQHARPKGDGVERHAVAPQRGLGFRPADDVVPVVLVEVLPRLGDELMQVVQVARRRRGVVDRGWLVGAILHDEPSAEG